MKRIDRDRFDAIRALAFAAEAAHHDLGHVRYSYLAEQYSSHSRIDRGGDEEGAARTAFRDAVDAYLRSPARVKGDITAKRNLARKYRKEICPEWLALIAADEARLGSN